LKIESPDFRDPVGLDIQTTSTDGSFSTPIPGDITGALDRPDGKVDMYDISYVARRFGIFPTHPLWNAHADVNSDGKIDIKDVSIVAINFGKHLP